MDRASGIKCELYFSIVALSTSIVKKVHLKPLNNISFFSQLSSQYSVIKTVSHG